MPGGDDLVQVGGLELVQGAQRQVVDDEQVDVAEPARLQLVCVVEAAALEALEELVDAGAMDRQPVGDGEVAQRASIVLPTPTGPITRTWWCRSMKRSSRSSSSIVRS